MQPRERILRAAIGATLTRQDYGPPEQNFDNIARLWRAYLRNKYDRPIYLDGVDIALMMALLKIARLQASPDHADSAVDLAGYAACAAEVAQALDPNEAINGI